MNAKELIEEIQAEKKSAIKEGTLREEKPLEPITDRDIPRRLPEGWEWCRLGDYAMKVTDYVASGSFASLKKNVLITNDENYAVMVKTADFSNGFSKNLTYTDEHGYKFLENSNLYGGELILSNIGSIGKVFIVPDLKRPMTLASNTVMVRMTHNEYNKYMYYMFKSPFGQGLLMSISSGTSMLKFNKTQLKSTIIPIAPLKEQFKICDVLDKVQGVIDKRERELEDLDNLIKARFVEMFGDPNIEFKFESHKFKEYVFDMTKGPFGSDMKKDLYVPKGEDTYKVYIQINAIQGNQDLGDYYISKEYFDQKISRFEVHPGDYIITCDGTLGKHLKLNENMERGVISPSLLRLTLDESKMTREYFEYMWDMYMLLLMKKEARNACLIHLPSAKVIGEVDVPVAPFELQKNFSVFVKQVYKSKVAVQKSLDETRKLFDSLMQEYFG